MQGLPIAAFVLVIPGLLCQTTIPRTGSFKLTKVYRSIRYTKVDFYISFTPSQPDPTIETTMTHNYWATNRTPIPSEGVFVEPRENQIKGLLSSGILKKGMARISFNKTEFLEFENGYMGLPYQPIIMIGFPNRQYFILRLRVDFEWKVDEKKDVTTESTTLSHTLISFPRGDQLYFNTSSKRPSRAENNLMEFLIPKDFEKNADPNNSSRIHMSLFFINGCGETTSGYFQVKHKNLRLFFDSSRRRGDNGWGQMIQFETYHRIVTVKKDYTNISLPILYWCDGNRNDPNKFPQGFISFRRRAVFSNRKSVLDELTSKVILTFGYRGNPFGYPSDYGFVWEETTDSNDVSKIADISLIPV
ncbi:uncharacterized protein LOC112557369 [Pomacea canaliculata]|uniref:uncharacterized protein LOC112557369 n=1 Tax=Pomacea canaliculata TaxID=400727 RepID=UPI000D731991|nr:uncharacterized protein LOC112557369 [Pomacea canaliculata]